MARRPFARTAPAGVTAPYARRASWALGRVAAAALAVAVTAVAAAAAGCGSAEPSTADDDTTATAGVTAVAPPTTAASAPDTGETADAGAAARTALIAELSEAVGGLSAASRSCLDSALQDDPAIAEALVATADPAMSPDLLRLIACLTPEEAAVLMPPDGGAAPQPGEIACLMSELEGEPDGERILAVLTGADVSGQGLTPQQSAVLGAAVADCGIDTDFGFPDADGDLEDMAVEPDVGGGWGECTVGLMLYPGDQCSYGTFSMMIRDDGAAVVDGSIGGITMGDTVMQSQSINLNQFSATRNGTVWTIESLP